MKYTVKVNFMEDFEEWCWCRANLIQGTWQVGMASTIDEPFSQHTYYFRNAEDFTAFKLRFEL